MKIPINVKLGFLFGTINCVIWYAVAKNLGFYEVDVYVIKNFTTLIILAIGIFLSTFLIRKQYGGYIEFKEALKTGILYSLIIGITLAIFNYIYYNVITPDTIEFFVSEAKKYHEAHNVKGVELQQFMDAERSHFNSFRVIPPVLFYGLIVSLLSGVVFQKKDPNKPIEN